MRKLVIRSVAALAIAATAGLVANAALASSSKVASTTFSLHPSVPFIGCMQKNPSTTPTAKATIKRGTLNDTLTLKLSGFKPGLGFDLFTVQNSNQTASGGPVTGFSNFGMAWYQSDISIDGNGKRQRDGEDDPARPDLRLRSGRLARADEHVPPRLLVRQPDYAGALRLPGHGHAVQR
jgi:hypothetical protein